MTYPYYQYTTPTSHKAKFTLTYTVSFMPKITDIHCTSVYETNNYISNDNQGLQPLKTTQIQKKPNKITHKNL